MTYHTPENPNLPTTLGPVNLPGGAEAICDSDNDRETWLARRTEGLGASTAAAIFGWSPHSTALQVYNEYATHRLIPKRAARDKARFTGWGHLQEPVIAGYYAQYEAQGLRRKTDRWVGRHAWMMRSLKHPFLYATPDYFVFADERDGPGALECKNMGLGAASHWRSWKHEPPTWFWIQLQHQMLVLDWKWGSVAVLEDGNYFRAYDYERNDRFCERLLNILGDFWERVQRGDPPAADPRKPTKQALARVAEEEGKVIMLPTKARRWFERRVELKRRLKDHGEELGLVENEVRRAMGDATYGMIPGIRDRKFSFKESTKQEYTVPESTSRTLRVVNHR